MGFKESQITPDNMQRSRRLGIPIPAALAAVTDRRYRRVQPQVPACLPQRNSRNAMEDGRI